MIKSVFFFGDLRVPLRVHYRGSFGVRFILLIRIILTSSSALRCCILLDVNKAERKQIDFPLSSFRPPPAHKFFQTIGKVKQNQNSNWTWYFHFMRLGGVNMEAEVLFSLVWPQQQVVQGTSGSSGWWMHCIAAWPR